ncbi:Leucine-responsive regulatory protein [Tritonibacter multivorans]|uniref:Leucine-responsive regulatory protein n=1 Tax=Tritonibacter multivorans TaxID=928856 RepID=A0A0P1G4I6_9RHOB|nr:Lrp/AsnC family transcriptional regulator [Tritonibacter multivorans]MDA7421916.1 Lrp/AsnC family transcriptional regulator [Tritonibacter multivorans]CUH76596.1 Leucine-responsive regulatory protein [Tritonibacter multivorans]SFD47747.1 transcriptional regulator, AsnC family [Tritonibacter multivorans]
MDSKDFQIIRELQKDGRLSNQELSERVNLSPSPCLRRVRNLEKEGVIRGYAAIVDEPSLGLSVTAFVRVTLERHTEETTREFEDSIRRIDEILDCYVMTGGSDYLLRVIAPDLQSYERFVRERLHKVKAIASIDTGFAYGVVKRSTLLPYPV